MCSDDDYCRTTFALFNLQFYSYIFYTTVSLRKFKSVILTKVLRQILSLYYYN